MKQQILVVTIILTILSCKKEIKVDKKENVKEEKKTIQLDKKETNSAYKLGFYVGTFEAVNYKENKKPSYSNRINISLDSIDEKNRLLFGHSIVAGNIRPFKGSFSMAKGNLTAKVKEPGDDKYDGEFNFVFYPDTKPYIVGTWNSYGDKLAVTKRKFKLYQKEFKYNPNQLIKYKEEYGNLLYNEKTKSFYESEDELEGEAISNDINKFNASNTVLTNHDIENLYKGDLEIIRNSIYARHGYSFKNRRMRYFFDSYVDWYIPLTIDIRNQLTQLEKDNIKLLKRYEKHAQKYYDSFGR